jgi:hypothetical protein
MNTIRIRFNSDLCSSSIEQVASEEEHMLSVNHVEFIFSSCLQRQTIVL